MLGSFIDTLQIVYNWLYSFAILNLNLSFENEIGPMFRNQLGLNLEEASWAHINSVKWFFINVESLKCQN